MKTLRPILLFTLLLVVGGFVGYGIGSSGLLDNIIPTKEDFRWYQIFYFVLLYLLVVAVHELGHLLTGMVLGYEFNIYVVGPLGIRRKEDRSIKPYFNKDLSSYGGLAATFPKPGRDFSAEDFAKIVIAGPIISILIALVCFAFGNLSSQPAQFFIFYTGFISLFIFFATTIPSRTGVFYTDRKRYQRLKSLGKEKEIELAVLKASSYLASKKPLSDMDISELEKITFDDSDMFKYTGYYYMLAHVIESDPDRIPEIKLKLKGLESELPSTFLKMMQKEIAKLELPPTLDT